MAAESGRISLHKGQAAGRLSDPKPSALNTYTYVQYSTNSTGYVYKFICIDGMVIIKE